MLLTYIKASVWCGVIVSSVVLANLDLLRNQDPSVGINAQIISEAQHLPLEMAMGDAGENDEILISSLPTSQLIRDLGVTRKPAYNRYNNNDLTIGRSSYEAQDGGSPTASRRSVSTSPDSLVDGIRSRRFNNPEEERSYIQANEDRAAGNLNNRNDVYGAMPRKNAEPSPLNSVSTATGTGGATAYGRLIGGPPMPNMEALGGNLQPTSYITSRGSNTRSSPVWSTSGTSPSRPSYVNDLRTRAVTATPRNYNTFVPGTVFPHEGSLASATRTVNQSRAIVPRGSLYTSSASTAANSPLGSVSLSRSSVSLTTRSPVVAAAAAVLPAASQWMATHVANPGVLQSNADRPVPTQPRSSGFESWSASARNTQQDAAKGLIPSEEDISDESTDVHDEVEDYTKPPKPEDYASDSPLSFPELGDGGGRRRSAEGIYAYCYPFTDDQIINKCSNANSDFNAAGVYVPMMMEVQFKHSRVWYSQLRRLKGTTGLQLVGVAFDNPNWKLITEILQENKGLFAGIIIEWIGDTACISDINLPTVDQLEVIKSATTDSILRYFVREQNYTICNADNPQFVEKNYVPLKTLSASSMEEELDKWKHESKGFEFPRFIQPVFGCLGGQEGLCYRAFNHNPIEACGSNQRYAFNPYEVGGGRLLHLFNETCAGLPPHDLYGVL